MLAQAGARQIYLAGQKNDIPGVDSFILAGCDALATLRHAHDMLQAKS
jgi:methylmalonyl-CoA mutase